jgi:hypothetical protein
MYTPRWEIRQAQERGAMPGARPWHSKPNSTPACFLVLYGAEFGHVREAVRNPQVESVGEEVSADGFGRADMQMHRAH